MGLDIGPDVAFFQSIPWTEKLIRHPDYVAVPTPSRESKKSTEDAMFAETLNTKDTIRTCLALQKKPTSNQAPVTELRLLLDLGYAVSGWPNVVHGGVISLIMDEAKVTLLQLSERAGNADIHGSYVTASFQVRYIRPIPTPSVIMVTARLRRVEGRKVAIDAVIENAEGHKMAVGESQWLRIDDTQPKL